MPLGERRLEKRNGRRHVLLLAARREALNAARLPVLLRDAGCRVTLYAERTAFARRSAFVDRHIAAPEDAEGYFTALGAHLECEGVRYDWVLPCTDTDVRGLYDRRNQAWARSIFPADAGSADAEAVVSKYRFGLLLERLGIPVPPARVASNLDDALTAAGALGYPVILKPLGGWAGVGTARADDDVGLRAAYAGVESHGRVLVQRYLEGRVGSVQALFNRGALRGWVSGYKLLTYPGPFSPSSCRLFRPIAILEQWLQQIGAALTLHGMMGLDFIERADTGQPAFIELNPRPSGLAHAGHVVGADLTRAIYELASGEPGSGIVRQRNDDIVLPLFPNDLLRGFREADWLSLARWMCVPGEWRDVPWRDPRLLVYLAASVARGAGSELGRVVGGR